MDDSTTHIFASLYEFSNAAKHDILEQFEASMETRKVEVGHEGNHFIIRCTKGDDGALLVFIGLLRRYIDAEVDRDLDLFEEAKIQRFPGTLRGSANADLDQRVFQGVPMIKADGVEVVDSTDLLLINHESIIRTWKPARGKERTYGGLNFSADLLSRIGNVTNCRIDLALNEVDLVVRGESKEDVGKATTKLDILHDSAMCRTTLASIFDYYIPEGEVDVLLQMSPLKCSLSRKLSTTLLSTSSPYFKLIQNLLTIEMISEGGVDLDRKVRPRPPNTEGSALWQDYPYNAVGNGSYKAEIYHNGPKATLQSSEGSGDTTAKPTIPVIHTIDQWVEESAAAADDPFAPIDHVEKPGEINIVADNVQAKPDLSVVRPRHIKVRKPKGLEILPAPAPVPSVATSDYGKIPTTADGTSRSASKSGSRAGDEHDSWKSDHTTSNESISAKAAMPTSRVNPPPIEPPFMPKQLETSTESYLHNKPTWDVKFLPQFKANTSLLGFDPSEELHERKNEQPNVGARQEFTAMGPKEEAMRVGNQGTNFRTVEGKVKQDNKERNGLFDIEERLQQVSEVETCQFNHTMNQQKAPTQVGSGNTALLKSFESSTAQLLGWTRSCAELVKLEVHLGRILINHQTGSAEYKNQPFPPNKWSQVFPAHEGSRKMETIFTNMLTTSSNDADFIMNLRLTSGRRIFQEEVCARKVAYYFVCETQSGEELVVEVGENGELDIKSPPRLIGAINWHFPKRQWDARLSITSHGQISNKYYEEAKAIVANLQVAPSSDGKSFGLFTKTATTELRIQSAMLHRETCHRLSDLYPDNVLRMREIQDLEVWQMTDKRCEYHATARTQPEMIEDRKLWWEFSLSSLAADTILGENEKMEIGELAKWVPTDILSKGVVKDLSSLAKDLVTRMDTIGYSNKGPKAGTGTRPSVLKDAGFW